MSVKQLLEGGQAVCCRLARACSKRTRKSFRAFYVFVQAFRYLIQVATCHSATKYVPARKGDWDTNSLQQAKKVDKPLHFRADDDMWTRVLLG